MKIKFHNIYTKKNKYKTENHWLEYTLFQNGRHFSVLLFSC